HSPPPCGEGLGVGLEFNLASLVSPHPRPLPIKGRGDLLRPIQVRSKPLYADMRTIPGSAHMAKAAKAGKGQAAPATAAGAAKVLVFAPEKPGQFTDSEKKLQAAGCEVVQGSAGWHNPQGNSEAEMVAMARGADAMMGTSIRSSPDHAPDHGGRARPA